MNPSSKKLYEAPSTECVELKLNTLLLDSNMDGSAMRYGYGDAQELEW